MIKYKEGYKYQIVEDYTVQTEVYPAQDIDHEGWIQLTKDGVLTIAKGYAWDGPSGPTIDTKNFMRGSLVHDALYQLMREGFLEPKWFHQANVELRKICLEDGMSWFRAFYVFRGVEIYGHQFAEPRLDQDIQTAP